MQPTETPPGADHETDGRPAARPVGATAAVAPGGQRPRPPRDGVEWTRRISSHRIV